MWNKLLKPGKVVIDNTKDVKAPTMLNVYYYDALIRHL